MFNGICERGQRFSNGGDLRVVPGSRLKHELLEAFEVHNLSKVYSGDMGANGGCGNLLLRWAMRVRIGHVTEYNSFELAQRPTGLRIVIARLLRQCVKRL